MSGDPPLKSPRPAEAGRERYPHGGKIASPYLLTFAGFVLLIGGIALQYAETQIFTQYVRVTWFAVAYLLVGWSVFHSAVAKIANGYVFNDSMLMSIAGAGALFVGKYPEGVAVMLMFAVGEWFQEGALHRAKQSITDLVGLANVRGQGAFDGKNTLAPSFLMQDVEERKAKAQQFITRFVVIYTPIVVILAQLVIIVPALVLQDFSLGDWLYRAAVSLVIACPCAVVVSVPLGYLGGIGAALRSDILFKGSKFLDLMRRLDTVVLTKTGILTQGAFEVKMMQPISGIDQGELLALVAALEANSSHLVAKAIVAYAGKRQDTGLAADAVEEIAGQGVCGVVNMRTVLAGNTKLMRQFGVGYPADLDETVENVITVAVDGRYSGYFVVADRIRPDAAQAVREIKDQGLGKLVILSGDKDTIVQDVAKEVGVFLAYGGLVPEDKATHVRALKAGGARLAFVGDAVADAALLAQADLGIAMNGLGFATMSESADVVIHSDQLCRIATARRISAATHRVVWQNIGLACVEKAVLLGFGAWGLVTMWEAALADVCVVFLVTLNAVRLGRMGFHLVPHGGELR